MIPPLYEAVQADSTLSSLIGTRVYPAGEATQDAVTPYITYQTVSGEPFNNLDYGSCADFPTIQIDVWADEVGTAVDVYDALRDVIEQYAYVVGFNLSERDADTRLYRISFDVDWLMIR